ncbi:hypothetical protein ACFRU3_12010 [Streptomyces sp. NPDC056910]|uniref:hypothetical protein n=1 Tax=Streptomyces sp. NPDC056910 TaxID=3345964 RepID=UPI00368A7457
MYIDVNALDQEARRLACLMADLAMECITLPQARSPEQEGAEIEERFSTELGASHARIAAAGSDEECILPSLLMAMAGQVAALAAEISLQSDRDVVEVIHSIGVQ